MKIGGNPSAHQGVLFSEKGTERITHFTFTIVFTVSLVYISVSLHMSITFSTGFDVMDVFSALETFNF